MTEHQHFIQAVAQTSGISKQTFECFVCKKNGSNNERVYLAGKDSHGKTMYISEDGITAHIHKFKQGGTSTKTTFATSTDTILSKLDSIEKKLDRLLAIEGQ